MTHNARMFAHKRIYLDYASATPVCVEAARAYARAAKLVGNPGSIHADGVAAKKVLEESRERIAHELGVKAREIIFTSGATEANNLAIVGTARALDLKGIFKGSHWVVSSIEHDSVLECFAEIERLGGTITHIDPDARGIISAERVARALRPETVLVSIGWGNNEIGVVQPLRDIARAIRAFTEQHYTTSKKVETSCPPVGPLLHTDVGQAPLYLIPHMHTLGVDMASFGSGKLYGPRGIGALYLSNNVEISPLSFGGSQERGLRAGTETPALASGFAEALALIGRERVSETQRLKKLRDELAHGLAMRIPGMIMNTDLDHSLPHMLNVSIPHIDAEYLVLSLDRAGISVSTKSACRAGEASSHVVAALGGGPVLDGWRAQNTLRFSLGRSTTSRDIARVLTARFMI